MSDELARVLAEHPWRPNWWRCGRTCEWVPNGDMHVTEQHTEHLADVTLAWFAASASAPSVTTEQVEKAIDAAVFEAAWDWADEPGVPSPHEAMRPTVDTVLAALGIEVTP